MQFLRLSFSWLISIIFIVVGLVFGYREYQLLQQGTHIRGRITEVHQERKSDNSLTYYPVVSFTLGDGKTLTKSFPSLEVTRQSTYYVGNSMPLIYDQATGGVEVLSFKGIFSGPLFFLVTGLLFGAVIFLRYKKNKLYETLKKEGDKLETKLQKVEEKKRGALSEYCIITSFNDSINNKEFIFYSENLPDNPAQYLPPTIDVYVDKSDYSKYYMDLSFLPPMSIRIKNIPQE